MPLSLTVFAAISAAGLCLTLALFFAAGIWRYECRLKRVQEFPEYSEYRTRLQEVRQYLWPALGAVLASFGASIAATSFYEKFLADGFSGFWENFLVDSLLEETILLISALLILGFAFWPFFGAKNEMKQIRRNPYLLARAAEDYQNRGDASQLSGAELREALEGLEAETFFHSAFAQAA